MRKTLPLSLAPVYEAGRCKPESCQVARASWGAAEGTMEMKVTWACQLELQRAETKVKSNVIVSLPLLSTTKHMESLNSH